MWKELIPVIKNEIRGYYQVFGPHDFLHTERVYKLALILAEEGSADLETVAFSALLHDVARLKERDDERICHAVEGAIMAAEILKGKTDKTEHIAYAIRTHRYRARLVPETLEAKILQDADRLDSLGAVVIARTFAADGMDGKPIFDPCLTPLPEYTGKSATGINHLYEKILRISPETFHTGKAREIAQKRYSFVEEFTNRFVAEWNGEM